MQSPRNSRSVECCWYAPCLNPKPVFSFFLSRFFRVKCLINIIPVFLSLTRLLSGHRGPYLYLTRTRGHVDLPRFIISLLFSKYLCHILEITFDIFFPSSKQTELRPQINILNIVFLTINHFFPVWAKFTEFESVSSLKKKKTSARHQWTVLVAAVLWNSVTRSQRQNDCKVTDIWQSLKT